MISIKNLFQIHIAVILLFLVSGFTAAAATNKPESLVWNSPGINSSGSMPLGNGDIGMNVWVEKGGDLLFYLGKSDAWDENAQLLKLGRIRVALSPNPFTSGAPFRQELNLAEGTIRIETSLQGKPLAILIWVDANLPVAHIGINSEKPVSARVTLELWRLAERSRGEKESASPAGLLSPDERETVYRDTVIDIKNNSILWCHRNRSSCWETTLKHQDMEGWIKQGHDPLINRTFGALIRGSGLRKDGDSTLCTRSPQKSISITIDPLTSQTATLEAWVQAVTAQAVKNSAISVKKAFAGHAAWWSAFWDRSYIKVSGTPEAEIVTRGYEFQRFMNACAGRGAYPVKFNGSLFTVDAIEPGETFDADYRRWGGGYWFQNTRLIYWPMIMSGDFDLMEPWFNMYVDALPLATARAGMCFGIKDAAMFPETMTFYGSFLNANYGYNRKGLKPGLTENTYIRRYWQGMIELLTILLDSYSVSGDDHLLNDKLLVLAPPFLRFYREYYTQRDDSGKIIFKPSQALETWHNAVNPLPEIAGLQWVLDGLLALPEKALPAQLRTEWKAFREILPPIPTRTYFWEKRTEVIPALQYDDCQNSENVALYAVFPYRIYGVGKPETGTGLATWAARPVKGSGCWRQDAIQAAMLGLADSAKAAVVYNFSTSYPASRFPAFWGPTNDWIPDMDHGGVASAALQRMLIQYDDGLIRLLPAWPKEWNAEFRLFAPGHTLVEGRVVNGKIEDLHLTPESSRSTVIGADLPSQK